MRIRTSAAVLVIVALAGCDQMPAGWDLVDGFVAPDASWWGRHGPTPCDVIRTQSEVRTRLREAGWDEVLADDFEGYGEDDWSAGSKYHGGGPTKLGTRWFGFWTGCEGPCTGEEGVRILTEPGPDGRATRVLHQQPAPPGPTAHTRSSLVVSAQIGIADFVLEVDRRTTKQLRPHAPNNWETAWLVFRYLQSERPRDALADPEGICSHQRGYYFVTKPGVDGGDHWELGKMGSGYEVGGVASGGCQRFLASGYGPVDDGRWQRQCIAAVGNRFAAWVDGARVVAASDRSTVFGDTDDRGPRYVPCPPDRDADARCLAPQSGEVPGGEPLWTTGAIGLYNEDAHVDFDNLRVWGRLEQPQP